MMIDETVAVLCDYQRHPQSLLFFAKIGLRAIGGVPDQTIHPMPPIHLFRRLVLHVKHSLPMPVSTTAQLSHTVFRHSLHLYSRASRLLSSIPPMQMSAHASATGNVASQSSQASFGGACMEFAPLSAEGAEDGSDQKLWSED